MAYMCKVVAYVQSREVEMTMLMPRVHANITSIIRVSCVNSIYKHFWRNAPPIFFLVFTSN